MSSDLLWRASLRELRNGIRLDPRRRTVLVIGLAVQLGLAAWASLRLAPVLARLRAEGEGAAERGLWLLSLALAMAAAGIAWLTLREAAFGDRARLLFTLPVGGARRARLLVGQCAFQMATGFGVALLGVFATLLRVLGWAACGWIALALVGVGLALWGVLLLQMGFGALPRAWRPGMAVALGIAVAAGAGALGLVLDLAPLGLLPLPPAWGGAVVAAALLGLLVGPLAGGAGGLYERAFFDQEAGASRARPRRILRFLTRGLARLRGPAGALLVREVLLRGRHPVEWLRFAVFAAALVLLFPWLQPVLAVHALPGALGVVAAVVGTALLYVFDGSTSPLGSEGSRLLHALTAPVPLRTLLRAKLAGLLAPLLAGAGAGVLALAARSALPAGETLWALAATALVLAGAALVFALGSAWDVDLELEIESGLRGFVQETAPTTTVRMMLFLLASLLAAMQVGLLERLPAGVGLVVLALFDGLLWLALGSLAERVLRTKLAGG